jgi:hypothetical protein
MGAITHEFVSAKSDGGDATLARPSDWNADHDVTGTLLDEGTSFPGGPTTGQKKYRTDLQMGFVYDGTRWICICPHYQSFSGPGDLDSTTAGAGEIAATTTQYQFAPVPYTGALGILVEDSEVVFFVVGGGTALSGSHKWVGLIQRDTGGVLATINVDSGSSAVWRRDTQALDAVYDNTFFMHSVGWTKTGTPGNLRALAAIRYRVIAT